MNGQQALGDLRREAVAQLLFDRRRPSTLVRVAQTLADPATRPLIGRETQDSEHALHGSRTLAAQQIAEELVRGRRLSPSASIV